jgi:hypothetical protein
MLGRSASFVAGGYGRGRGQRIALAERGQTVECFVLKGVPNAVQAHQRRSGAAAVRWGEGGVHVRKDIGGEPQCARVEEPVLALFGFR